MACENLIISTFDFCIAFIYKPYKYNSFKSFYKEVLRN